MATEDNPVSESAPTVGILVPAGYSPTIAAGDLVISADEHGAVRMLLLHPLDLLLHREAIERFESAQAETSSSITSMNAKRRLLASALLSVQTALEIRAFRILSEKYHDDYDKLQNMSFVAMWNRTLNKVKQDPTLKVEGSTKETRTDIEKLYAKRKMVAHYRSDVAFHSDPAELERLITFGITLLFKTQGIVVNLASSEVG